SWRESPEQRRVRFSEELLEAGMRLSRALAAVTGDSHFEKRFQARKQRMIATQLLNEQQYEEAFGWIESARKLAGETQDRGLLFSIHVSSAYARLKLDQPEEALKDCQAALELAKEIGENEKLALAFYNLGAAYLHLSQSGESLAYSRKAAQAAQAAGKGIWEANARLNLGTAEFDNGDYDAAEGEFLRALDLSRQAGNPLAEGRALYNLGLVDHSLSRWAPALQRFEESLPFVQQVDIRHSHEIDDFNYIEKDVLERLLECYAKLGRQDEETVSPIRKRLQELEEKERSASGRRH
ncbi:MAG: tetratricopeptide repeat protein, partial [Acidobacteriota bacterium]